MENLLRFENGQDGQNSGQEVAKTPAPAASTHGSFAKLKNRVQRHTRAYYGRQQAPQYMLRMQCRGRREWFELEAELDASAKLAREIDQFLRCMAGKPPHSDDGEG